MGIKASIKKILLGQTIPQEYICLPYEDFTDPFRIFLTLKNSNTVHDVTRHHIFLGYRPLIIGVSTAVDHELFKNLSTKQEICLFLDWQDINANQNWRGFAIPNAAPAKVILELNHIQKLNHDVTFIYTGKLGYHNFRSAFHQFTNSLYYRLKRKKPGNIDLPGNLYDQVRIAYAYPRNISLITVGDGNSINIFPTDLHGPIGEKRYAGSLRNNSLACKQVDHFKKIVISQINAERFKRVYSMGKNHMKEVRDKDDFELDSRMSEILKLPLPAGVLRYRELEQICSYDINIHRLQFYKIINQVDHTKGKTLFHVHNYYVEWRKQKGLDFKYLLR